MTETIQQLKQLRADIDVLINMGKQLQGKSRETSVAFTKLQEGRMHIGNAIHELGASKVYEQSKNAENNEIDKYHVDDVTPIAVPEDFNAGTHVQNVKIMRREIDPISERIKKLAFLTTIYLGEDYSKVVYAETYKWTALIKLREAQNWYGMELGRIRDEK